MSSSHICPTAGSESYKGVCRIITINEGMSLYAHACIYVRYNMSNMNWVNKLMVYDCFKGL